MKPGFLRDFADRKRQVRYYLEVVKQTEDQFVLGSSSRDDEGRLLTLRAGAFLILYNLIEATTRAALEAIHQQITSRRVSFSEVSLLLRQEIVGRFKKGADPANDHTFDDFPSAFVGVALDQEIKLSGNVDGRLIRELAKCYGFSCKTPKRTTWGGVDLFNIKNNRNDLAHGYKTFEEVGRAYSFSELEKLSGRSMRYMEVILENVASFLRQEGYLETVGGMFEDDAADGAS